MRVVFRYANDAEVISYKNGTPRSVIVADYKEWLKARAVAEWYVLEGWYDDDRTDRKELLHGAEQHRRFEEDGEEERPDVSELAVGVGRAEEETP